MKPIYCSAIARVGSVLLTCAAVSLGTGCGAEVYSRSEPAGPYPGSVEDDAVVYVDVAPPNIEAYPHYYYAGSDAYYVDGRWYRHGPRGWGYYRKEPAPLARQRPNVVQASPRPAERAVIERAPLPPSDRPGTQPAPSPPRPGVVEAQPRNGAPRVRPGTKRDESKEPRREPER